MVEPHIHTTLTATSDFSMGDSEEVAWEVETSAGVYEYPVGNPVVVLFNSTGKLSVKWCIIKPSSSSSRRRLSESVSFISTPISAFVSGAAVSPFKKWLFGDQITSVKSETFNIMNKFNGFVGPKAPQYNTYSLSSTSASSYVSSIKSIILYVVVAPPPPSSSTLKSFLIILESIETM
jgi:hypothetical protein